MTPFKSKSDSLSAQAVQKTPGVMLSPRCVRRKRGKILCGKIGSWRDPWRESLKPPWLRLCETGVHAVALAASTCL